VKKSTHIINASVLVVLVLGVLKSVVKSDKLPSVRFFFGAGVMWLFLSAMNEVEEDIAKTLALVIATVVVLRDAGDVFGSYLGGASGNLGLSSSAQTSGQVKPAVAAAPTTQLNPVFATRRQALPGTVMAQPYYFPARIA